MVLCQLNNVSCFGCCGNDFADKKEVMSGILTNSKDFSECEKTLEGLLKFRDRERLLHDCGICYNLVFSYGKIVCPLHPQLNQDHDLRIHHCDTDFACPSFNRFADWPDKQREEFIIFLDTKQLDHYDYSIGIITGKLMLEFANSP